MRAVPRRNHPTRNDLRRYKRGRGFGIAYPERSGILPSMKTTWALEQRQTAQNSNFRQDRLCVSIVRPVKQATRDQPAQELPAQWIGHSCVGNVYFKTLDGARQFAAEMGYEGIYL
jgi:hypothetical protein